MNTQHMPHRRIEQLLHGELPWESVTAEEWDEVGVYLEQHPEADIPTRAFDENDRHLATMMRDVPVPEDGPDRLLALLEQSTETAAEPQDVSSSVVPISAVQTEPVSEGQRMRRRTLVGLTACLLIGGLFYLVEPPVAPSWSLAELRDAAGWATPDDLDRAASAHGQNGDVLRQWELAGLLIESPQALPLPGRARQVGSLYQFRVPLRGGIANGRLLVVPTELVTNPPASDVFNSQEPAYLRAPQASYASTAWTDGDLTYIALVELTPGAGDALQQLEQVLTGQVA